MSPFSDPITISDQAKFSLDGFFTRLQNAGFQLRPDDYAEVLKVLTAFLPRTPDELAELIAPLIVTNEEEQNRFYALFAEQQRAGSTITVEPPTPLTVWQKMGQFRWYWLILLLSLLGGFIWYRFFNESSVPTSLTSISTSAQSDSLFTPSPSRYLSIVSSSGSVTQSSRLNPYHIWIPSLLALLCTVGAVYLLRRVPRQAPQAPGMESDALMNRFRSDRPPYVLPLPNRESELVAPSRSFDEFVTTLRQCREDEVSTLNVSRTLASTVRSGGMPELIFRHRLREEEFLFLIDTSRPRSQQLHLFEFIFRALSRESVYVERFFYQTPFDQFHNEWFPNGLSLNELANRYPTSNLIIWGDGYPLLFDAYAILDSAFVGGLRRWEHRAILTPVPFPDWDHRERALQSEFLVLPADMAGQLRLMQALQDNQTDQTAYLISQTDLYSLVDVDFKNVKELQEYLGDDLFQWLCATAVYGKVRWEILIEMGRAVLPDPADISIPNLLKLARISWLRDGNFPDVIRLELLKALRPDNEVKARQTLLDLLYYADVQFPDGYFFDEERYLLRTTNQFVLYKHQPVQFAEYEPSAQEYEQLWQGKKLPDVTMRQYLDNPAKGWDNLLGKGSLRMRLTDQFATDALSTRLSSSRWRYVLAVFGEVLLGYVGYLLWQKPAFARIDDPVTYTFVFRPNACMSLAELQKSAVGLIYGNQSMSLTFRDSTATVSFSGKEATTEQATLLVDPMNMEKAEEDTINFPLTAQRHVFEMRGGICAPVTRDKVEIFYSNSNVATTKYLAEKVAEVLAKQNKYTIIRTPLSKQSAAKYNVSQNEIRYDNENDPEYITALELQKTIRTSSATEAGQLNFSLVRVMKQKTPQYISIFIVGNSSKLGPCPPNCSDSDPSTSSAQSYSTNNAGQRVDASTSTFGSNVVRKNKTAPDAYSKLPVSKAVNKFLFNTGKPVETLNSTQGKDGLGNGIVVPGAPRVLVDVLRFEVNQAGAYELAAATAPSTYQSSQFTAFLLPTGAINQKGPLNPDGMYSALTSYLRSRLSARNLNVTQIETLAQLPKYQDPWSKNPHATVEQSQNSTKQYVWVFVLASLNYDN